MKKAEFVETHQGGKALHFEGYAYSKIRDPSVMLPRLMHENKIAQSILVGR